MLEYIAGAITTLIGVLIGASVNGLNKGDKSDGAS